GLRPSEPLPRLPMLGQLREDGLEGRDRVLEPAEVDEPGGVAYGGGDRFDAGELGLDALRERRELPLGGLRGGEPAPLRDRREWRILDPDAETLGEGGLEL